MSVDSSDPREGGRGGFRTLIRRIVSPVVSAFAVVYFVLDAVVLGILRPFLAWLGQQSVLSGWAMDRRSRALSQPFLLGIPVVILEPLKPLGLYVIATGHPIRAPPFWRAPKWPRSWSSSGCSASAGKSC